MMVMMVMLMMVMMMVTVVVMMVFRLLGGSTFPMDGLLFILLGSAA